MTLNIVCFGVKDDEDGSLAREIVMELHERGEAAPSLTILDGDSGDSRGDHQSPHRRSATSTPSPSFSTRRCRRARKEPHDFGALVEPHGPGKTRLSED